MPEILLRVNAKGDASTVRDAVASNNGVRSWWSTQVDGPDGTGSVFKVGFPEAPITFDFRLDEVSDGRIACRCLGGPAEWIDAPLAFELTPSEGGGTSILFRHGGWTSTDDPFPFIAYSWAQILARLQSYVDTGRPDPFFVVRT